jgi:hypothetical protein
LMMILQRNCLAYPFFKTFEIYEKYRRVWRLCFPSCSAWPVFSYLVNPFSASPIIPYCMCRKCFAIFVDFASMKLKQLLQLLCNLQVWNIYTSCHHWHVFTYTIRCSCT